MAPEPKNLRVSQKSQSLEGRAPLEFGRRPPRNRRQPHNWTPMTSQNDLVPGLRPSYKIGQTRFGFADRNIHRLPNLLAAVAAAEILIRTLV
jgi:hypothetical protein